MIHKIWASDKQFKPIEFHSGLNIVLAERASESNSKNTRNGAGKTTLLNIMHFCLGAESKKLSLPLDKLHGWAFYISLDVCGKRLTAKRSISNDKIIEIEADCYEFPIIPEISSEGIRFYKNNAWKELLGRCLFEINVGSSARYEPSFRSLIPYFMRRKPSEYNDPFKYLANQKTYQYEMYNAYLLGLNWLYASEAQELRDKLAAVKALASVRKLGIGETEGELEAKRVRIEQEISMEDDAIKSFNVHPQYKEIQESANKLTNKMHDFTNKALLLKRKIDGYEKTVSKENIQDKDSVEKLFSEAGVLFSSNIKKSLGEAKRFHEEIVSNRKLFLEAEITQLKNSLRLTEESIETASAERAELLKILETHGALEEFSVIQERMVEKKGELVEIKNKISNLIEMDQCKKEVKLSQVELEKKLRRDYEQSRSEWEKAIVLFNENSQALYKKPGNLIINIINAGYKFDVEINKSSSEGVGKMKIFCYDLMLVELMKQRGGIDFLFHDSSLFDGVDSRQRAYALIHAHRKAIKNNFQYICALNSDMIPNKELQEEGFNIDEFVRLTLKDKHESDSVLGFYFEVAK